MVQSREIWQVIAGLLSYQVRQSQPTRRVQTPNTYVRTCVFFVLFFVPIFFLSLLLLSSTTTVSVTVKRAGSQGTTAALHPCLSRFVTATNGASACGFVSVRACVRVIVGLHSSTNQGHSLNQQQRCHSDFNSPCIFHFCYSVCCCVPVFTP